MALDDEENKTLTVADLMMQKSGLWRLAPGEHQSTHLPDGHRLATTCLDVDFLKAVKIIIQSEYLVLGELASSCNLSLCIFAKLENQIFLQSFLRFGSGLYTW